MDHTFLAIASAFGLMAVALGAFGAHALKERVPAERLAVFQTGVQYQMIHALGLLGIAVILHSMANPSGLLLAAGWLFIVGVILFSGSLYTLVLSKVKIFGAITPLGGVAFIAGWACLLIYAFHWS